MSFTYLYVEKFITHSAYKLYHQALPELLETTLSPQYNGISFEIEAIIAMDSYKPVGFMAFELQKWNSSVHIDLAYVLPEYRRRGIHTGMFDKLVQISTGKGMLQIYSSVNVDNKASQASMEKQGRIAKTINYRYPLVDWLK